MAYNFDNVFAKIIRKEIPCDFIIETAYTLVFKDISPKAPLHLLIIPKGAYETAFDFYAKASEKEIIDFSKTIAQLVEKNGLIEPGFKLQSNAREYGNQEVSHFHMHLMGPLP